MSSVVLTLWTVYYNAADYPGKYVVRAWDVATPRPECSVHETLAEARAALPRGLFNLGRFAEDDPVIVETWV